MAMMFSWDCRPSDMTRTCRPLQLSTASPSASVHCKVPSHADLPSFFLCISHMAWQSRLECSTNVSQDRMTKLMLPHMLMGMTCTTGSCTCNTILLLALSYTLIAASHHQGLSKDFVCIGGADTFIGRNTNLLHLSRVASVATQVAPTSVFLLFATHAGCNKGCYDFLIASPGIAAELAIACDAIASALSNQSAASSNAARCHIPAFEDHQL